MSEELKNYMFYKPIGWIISTVVFACLLIAFIICAIIGTGVKPIGAVVFSLGLLASIIFWILNRKRVEKAQENLSLCQHMDADFRVAIPLKNGHIKFGEEWIFVKGLGRFIRYDEIRQVYQYIHKTNGVEDKRALKYIDAHGKKRMLCKLKLHGESGDELLQMVSIICQKNPSVRVGYSK